MGILWVHVLADAVYDTMEDVPEEVRTNKRYEGADSYTVSDTAKRVAEDFGTIDILVHSLANGPEVRFHGCCQLTQTRRGMMLRQTPS